ncbi:MAG: NFACT family protein [Fimbriimonadaceae bacterium]|jgi:predicted ribosome quality control (RQC) complex YloA/Tae2 family protein|nr:NFACT family protein [Fimbriimonadaceae bacterium]
MKTPFDAICLAAVVKSLQPLVGAKIQRVWVPDGQTVILGLYAEGRERLLFITADAKYPRAHLISRRPKGDGELPALCQFLRREAQDGKIVLIRQRGLDRILEIGIAGASQDFQLVAELTGRHAHLLVVSRDRRVIAAHKWLGTSQSVRPVLANQPYSPPPFEPKPSLLVAEAGDDLDQFEGISPFLKKLLASGLPLPVVQELVRTGEFGVFAGQVGIYPLPLATLDATATERSDLHLAFEQHFSSLEAEQKVASLRQSLKSQLERVLLARQVAKQDIDQAIETARLAPDLQRQGELILAYQGMIQEGDETVTVWDYDGKELQIVLRPDQNPIQNASRLFEKAKRAKTRLGEVSEQGTRIQTDIDSLEELLEDVARAETVAELEEARDFADRRRWLFHQRSQVAKEDRPHGGFSIREFLSPSGWKVLYGTNATSNDYLTTKVAKPNDWWFHVRGQTSSHVVLQTMNQPQKVQKPDLEFAAQLAVRNSVAKHSSFVAVDYTLKKYVRKPRGSAAGFATYVNEKTLHVDP